MTQPCPKRMVDVLEAPFGIGGIEADRGVLEEIDELLLLLADDLLHLPARGDVGDAPQHEAGLPLQGTGRDFQPFGPARWRGEADFPLSDLAGIGDVGQALDLPGGLVLVAEIIFEPLQGGRRGQGEHGPERGIGVKRLPLGPGDQARVGFGLQRADQEVFLGLERPAHQGETPLRPERRNPHRRHAERREHHQRQPQECGRHIGGRADRVEDINRAAGDDEQCRQHAPEGRLAPGPAPTGDRRKVANRAHLHLACGWRILPDWTRPVQSRFHPIECGAPRATCESPAAADQANFWRRRSGP